MKQLLNHLVDPDPEVIGHNVYEFMDFLGGPCSLLLTGQDTSRTRAMVTLLHGNEPSGVMALFRWLKSKQQPAVNILCVLGSVDAALFTPPFNNRVLSPQRDLNRCFREPFDDEQGKLAQNILQILQAHRPEAIVDIHNTSGSGPAFAVATHMDPQHDALTSLFTERIVITHLRLGALMEISDKTCPTVTIECGGRLDDAAHEIAWDGINRYFKQQDVLNPEITDWGLDILNNPVRLEIRKDVLLNYAEAAAFTDTGQPQLTLMPSIEHLNAGMTAKDTLLGWTNADSLSSLFTCLNSQNQDVVDQVVYINNGQLHIQQDLKLFMITTNAGIAKMDCLFYAVTSSGEEICALAD